MLTSDEVTNLLRESAREAIKETGLSTAFSDGTERGAPAASGKYPPSTTYQDDGDKENLVNPGNEGTTKGEMRGAAQAAGRAPFSSGGPAPRDFPYDGDTGSDHVSDGKRTPKRSDESDTVTYGASGGGTVMAPMDMGNPQMLRTYKAPLTHANGSLRFPGEVLLETAGFSYHGSVCATCSHNKAHHALAGMDNMCLHCKPLGSTHKFSEVVDMTPKLMTVPLYPANPPDPGDVKLPTQAGTGASLTESTYFVSEPEAHRRMFTDVQQALIRLDILHEALLPWRGKSDVDEGGDVRKEQMDAARDRAETYNKHTVAAHRQTLAAYQSGNHSEHHVAEGHHSLAADAAEAAAGDYPDNHPAKRDYKIAAGYHKQQMQAHHHAAIAAHRGAVPGRHEIAIDAPFRAY